MNVVLKRVFKICSIHLTFAAPRSWRNLLVLLGGLTACNPMVAQTIFKADFTFSPSSPAPGQPVSFSYTPTQSAVYFLVVNGANGGSLGYDLSFH